MKKLLALALSLILVVSVMTIVASAEDFVVSPGKVGAPELVGDGDGYTVVITAYKDRANLDATSKEKLETAYGEIVAASSVNDLVSEDLTAGLEGDTDIAVAEVFYASCDTQRDSYTFKLRSASFADENFVALIHYVNGAFQVEENVEVKGDVATVTVDQMSPFAIVVVSNYNEAPQTNDIAMKIAIPGAVCFALIGGGLLVLARNKKEEN